MAGKDRLTPMSQHYIDTPQFEVIVGWDRPLQYFFGTVFTKAKKDTDHEVVFATLELPEGGVQTVEELANVLQSYLRLPDELLKCLEEDRVNNRGNVVRHWAVPDVQQ
jgi:hypothetical protein